LDDILGISLFDILFSSPTTDVEQQSTDDDFGKVGELDLIMSWVTVLENKLLQQFQEL